MFDNSLISAFVKQWRLETHTFHLLWDRVAHTPDGAVPETLHQYVRCYLIMLIRGFLFTNELATLVPLRWLPLLEDFDRCYRLSWGLHCSVIPTTHCTSWHCVMWQILRGVCRFLYYGFTVGFHLSVRQITMSLGSHLLLGTYIL
ncbi:hypothetical protein AHAS_Ahas20G0273700 [Arachis hypogaea]